MKSACAMMLAMAASGFGASAFAQSPQPGEGEIAVGAFEPAQSFNVAPLFMLKGAAFIAPRVYGDGRAEDGKLAERLSKTFAGCKPDPGGRPSCPPGQAPSPFDGAKPVRTWHCQGVPGEVTSIFWYDTGETGILAPPPDLHPWFVARFPPGALDKCKKTVLSEVQHLYFAQLLVSRDGAASQPAPKEAQPQVLGEGLLARLAVAWKAAYLAWELPYVGKLAQLGVRPDKAELERTAALELFLKNIRLSDLKLFELQGDKRQKRYLVSYAADTPTLSAEQVRLMAWLAEADGRLSIGRARAYPTTEKGSGLSREFDAYIVVQGREFVVGAESVSDHAAYYAIDEFVGGRMIRRANVGDRDPSAIAVGK